MQPPSLPPPGDDQNPPVPLPYLSSLPGEWEIAGSFPTVGDWHRANKILSSHGITARMRITEGDDSEVQMLVFQTELEWARDLLARGALAPAAHEGSRGFPLDDAVVKPADPNHRRAIPVENQGLSSGQRITYSVFIYILCGVLAVCLVLLFYILFS